MSNTRYQLVTLLSSVLMLTACGGGGSSANSSTASISNDAQTASFSDCFTFTPGTKFVLNDGYKMLIVLETFNGQTAYGQRELRPDDSTFGTTYWTKDSAYIYDLGQLDDSGSTDVYTGFRFPTNITPGQTLTISYTDLDTVILPAPSSPLVNTYNLSQSFTFASFETLTLGGRTFTNACKITAPNYYDATKTDVTWFAKGFGWIRAVTLDNQGNEISTSVRQLASIISAP